MKYNRKTRLSLPKVNLLKINKQGRDVPGNKCFLRSVGKVYLISETIDRVKTNDSASVGLEPHILTESSPSEIIIRER